MLENIRLAFYGIRSHKLRSGLTMLGVVIGVASMIAMLSTVAGANELIKNSLVGTGGSSVTIELYDGDAVFDFTHSESPAGVPALTADVKDELLSLREVAAASFFHERFTYGGVYNGATPLSGGRLIGADEDWFSVCGYELLAGRGFTAQDRAAGRKLAILDEAAVTSLFAGEYPVDGTIEIMGEPFVVIGVARQREAFQPVVRTIEEYYAYMDAGSGTVFVPDTVWPMLYRFDEPAGVVVRARNADSIPAAGQKAASVLNKYLTVSEGSVLKYRSGSLLERARALAELADTTRRQLTWVAVISLLVGGVGVMNIMLVSVTERVREIGVKKALGARSRVILAQFLTEASVLTGVGGVIGVAAGAALSLIVSRAAAVPVSISAPYTALAFVFSIVVGLIFGLLPAIRASRLDPIEALRQG